jgi:FMN-dependent NADH-azoreductase
MITDEQMSEQDKKIKEIRYKFIEQLESVDTVVISVPVWNY